MLLLFAEQAAEAAHQAPVVVQLVNHYVGEPLHNLQMQYTYPFWTKFFAYFGTTQATSIGESTVENAVPSSTFMFVIAFLLFPIELISNFVRPMSLGIRLFGNLFGDEQILGTIGNLATNIFAWINTTSLFVWIHTTTGISIPEGPWLLPVIIMPLSLFV